jgi:hypothetical protein
MTAINQDFTKVEDFMAAGSARGFKIENLKEGRLLEAGVNKTQVVVASGNILFFGNLFPAIIDHRLMAIPKFEQTKVRGIVTIPTYLHMACVKMTRYAEHNSLSVFNNRSLQERRRMLQQVMRLPACALD